jgi:hypothetical protein
MKRWFNAATLAAIIAILPPFAFAPVAFVSSAGSSESAGRQAGSQRVGSANS